MSVQDVENSDTIVQYSGEWDGGFDYVDNKEHSDIVQPLLISEE